MGKCVFAGSFDPFTNGHADLVDVATDIFGECHVVVASNPKKKYMFSEDLRFYFVREYLEKVNKRAPVTLWNGLTIDYAQRVGAEFIIRGIRDSQDMVEEMRLANTNFMLSKGKVQTVFLPCKPELREVSSSLVRELINMNKDVDEYIPYKLVTGL